MEREEAGPHCDAIDEGTQMASSSWRPMMIHQHPGKDSPVRTGGDSIVKPKPVFPVSIPIDDHAPFPATYRNVIKTIFHLDA